MDWWKLLPVAVCIVQFLMAWVFWSLGKKFVSADACKECQDKCSGELGKAVQAAAEVLNELEKRVSRNEDKLEAKADPEDISEILVALAGLTGEVKVAIEKVAGLDRVVSKLDRIIDRHEQHLLQNGGK